MKNCIVILLMVLGLLAGCGGAEYMSKQERKQAEEFLKLTQYAQERFEEKSLQTSQIVLKVVQDSRSLFEKTLERTPEEYKGGVEDLKKQWLKDLQYVVYTSNAMQSPRYYESLSKALASTQNLLKKIIEIDEQV